VFFIPTGRGKDTARTLPSWSPKDTGPSLPRYVSRTVDVGLVTSAGGDRYFINASSVGVSAFTARQASGYPRWLGSSSYLIAAVHALAHERPFHATLHLEGLGDIDMPRCHIVVVANGRFFGGGMQVAPQADPADGCFDVLALADASPRDLATALPMLLRGTHLRHPRVRHWRTPGVQLVTGNQPPLESDGEQWTTGPASFTIVPKALTWLEPA
jgi:diacylglycerol kinase family enzyme